MPKIFEYLGFVFFFYANDHLPVHCHVKKGCKEMKVELEIIDGVLLVSFIRSKRSPLFSPSEMHDIEVFIRAYHLAIIDKWEQFFLFGKSPIFDKISNKINKQNLL